ncbi:uncharacterized protein HaLaN_12825 [Haematococcus lacustris]|uniref:Cytochrome P450 n=1 Tax=Haematococcus lacustris TaxID=44745 RepID=A0A699Z4B9_HAELA|nr:uncharacterized protein HaLaN_12825 [Haematococcus lacustris]
MKQGLEAARTDLGPISLTYLYSQRHVQHVLQDSRGLYTKSDVDRRALGLLIGNSISLGMGGQEAAAASGCPMRTLTLAATPPAPTAAAARLAETAGAPPSLQPVRSGSAAAGSEASPHQHLDLAGCPARHVEVAQPGAAAQPAMAQHSGAGQQAATPQPLASGQQAGGAKQAGGTAPPRQAGQQQRDLLDMLLLARNEDGSALGDSELRDEVMTMVTAGHETSANVLAWAMYQLALHPEAVHQAVAEVHAVCGPGPEAVQPHHLPKLRWDVEGQQERGDGVQYLEAVLQETLRLHPPVWAFDRQAAQQDELPGGVQIVQGSYILLSPYALHRQPDLFPEPDAFKPERFLEGGSAAALPRFQYIPFGGGGRSCIGSTFAMYEMKSQADSVIENIGGMVAWYELN